MPNCPIPLEPGVRVGDGTVKCCRVVRPPLYIDRDSEAQATALLGFVDNK
jgi:hypothetical protein